MFLLANSGTFPFDSVLLCLSIVFTYMTMTNLISVSVSWWSSQETSVVKHHHYHMLSNAIILLTSETDMWLLGCRTPALLM